MKRILAFFSMIAIVWVLLCFLVIKGCFLSMDRGQVRLVDSNLITTADGFVFDTGANYSYIPKSKVSSPICLLPTIVADSQGEKALSTMCYGKRLSIDNQIAINDFAFVAVNDPYSSHNEYEAIIGMNVLSKMNFLISFRGNNIEFFPIDYQCAIPDSAIDIEYEGASQPRITLEIGSILVDDILVDTGFDNDLALESNLINRLTNKFPYSKDVSENKTLFALQKQDCFSFPGLEVNSSFLDNVVINQSSKRLVGLKYFKRFNHLFWDNLNRRIYLWN